MRNGACGLPGFLGYFAFVAPSDLRSLKPETRCAPIPFHSEHAAFWGSTLVTQSATLTKGLSLGKDEAGNSGGTASLASLISNDYLI
ncbi:unannotated protein [freshwater metagenome]|uniref:Unannotated protein n=1 Tax=freshwater metagenome TaxID=449393 RepID=A0A6J6EQ55_9ZZZZ